MESFEVLLTPTEWVKVHAPQKWSFLQLSVDLQSAYFMEPTQLLPHTGHWVLAGLHAKSFNVMTPDNDCNSIPHRSVCLKLGCGIEFAFIFTIVHNKFCKKKKNTLILCGHIHNIDLVGGAGVESVHVILQHLLTFLAHTFVGPRSE